MYKLLNKLFGWDYVHWVYCTYEGTARVRVSYDGDVYIYTQLFNTAPVILTKHNKSAVLFFTCKREKYFPEDAKI